MPLSFVGSDQAGRYIYERGSANGKRVQSNMGAKNHGIFMPDANKEQALNQVTLIVQFTQIYRVASRRAQGPYRRQVLFLKPRGAPYKASQMVRQIILRFAPPFIFPWSLSPFTFSRPWFPLSPSLSCPDDVLLSPMPALAAGSGSIRGSRAALHGPVHGSDGGRGSRLAPRPGRQVQGAPGRPRYSSSP